MLKSARSNWIALASSLLLLAAIFYILSKEQNFEGVLGVWQQTDLLPLAVAVIFMIFVFAISAWRVQTIMLVDGLESVSFLPLLRIQFISQFMAHGTPISAFADVVRAVMIKLRFNISPGRSFRIVLYERICGALGAVVLGLAASIVQFMTPYSHVLVKAQLVLWSAGIAAAAILLAIGNLEVTTGINLLDRIVKAAIFLGQMLRKPVVAGNLLLASLGQLLAFSAIFLVLAYGMHLIVPVWSAILFMPLIYFVSSLPIFYQGWGGREAIVIATIGSSGTITSAEAIALSIAFGVVVFAASLPGAMFWIMRPSMRKAVRMEVEGA
jgi:hypothetical protein